MHYELYITKKKVIPLINVNVCLTADLRGESFGSLMQELGTKNVEHVEDLEMVLIKAISWCEKKNENNRNNRY